MIWQLDKQPSLTPLVSWKLWSDLLNDDEKNLNTLTKLPSIPEKFSTLCEYFTPIIGSKLSCDKYMTPVVEQSTKEIRIQTKNSHFTK